MDLFTWKRPWIICVLPFVVDAMDFRKNTNSEVDNSSANNRKLISGSMKRTEECFQNDCILALKISIKTPNQKNIDIDTITNVNNSQNTHSNKISGLYNRF